MGLIDTGALRFLAECDGLNTQGDCDSPYPPEDMAKDYDGKGGKGEVNFYEDQVQVLRFFAV